MHKHIPSLARSYTNMVSTIAVIVENLEQFCSSYSLNKEALEKEIEQTSDPYPLIITDPSKYFVITDHNYIHIPEKEIIVTYIEPYMEIRFNKVPYINQKEISLQAFAELLPKLASKHIINNNCNIIPELCSIFQAFGAKWFMPTKITVEKLDKIITKFGIRGVSQLNKKEKLRAVLNFLEKLESPWKNSIIDTINRSIYDLHIQELNHNLEDSLGIFSRSVGTGPVKIYSPDNKPLEERLPVDEFLPTICMIELHDLDEPWEESMFYARRAD